MLVVLIFNSRFRLLCMTQHVHTQPMVTIISSTTDRASKAIRIFCVRFLEVVVEIDVKVEQSGVLVVTWLGVQLTKVSNMCEILVQLPLQSVASQSVHGILLSLNVMGITDL